MSETLTAPRSRPGADLPELHFVRAGPRGGVPVVLLHPVGLDLGCWGAQIEALGVDYDVVAVDLPGYGASPGGPADWTLERVTEILAAFLATLGAPRVHLVGLSVGGMIAQSLTIAHPALVHSLTLLDTSATWPEPVRETMRERAAAARAGGMAAVVEPTVQRWFVPATHQRRPDVVDGVRKTLLADDPAVYAATWDMISGLDLGEAIADITCPTMVVVGECDTSSPLASAQHLRDTIPGATLNVVPGAAHMTVLERPAAVNPLLLAFLGTTW